MERVHLRTQLSGWKRPAYQRDNSPGSWESEQGPSSLESRIRAEELRSWQVPCGNFIKECREGQDEGRNCMGMSYHVHSV